MLQFRSDCDGGEVSFRCVRLGALARFLCCLREERSCKNWGNFHNHNLRPFFVVFCLTPGTTKGCFEEEEAARPCSPALFSCCVGSTTRDPALGTAPSLSPRQPLGSSPLAAAPSSPFLPHLSIHVPRASRKGQVCSARAWPLVSVGLPESPSPFCLVPPVRHLVPWFPRWTGSGCGEQTRGGQGQGWDSL